jgi:DNA helicase-2/ATP-dependent DNA helicase PcrA
MSARHLSDFDDLVVGAANRIESDPRLRMRWQSRFTHICVDEFQDVDAAQLRLVRILAEPERNLFVVGDDDQTIYAWRLADVRRILDFSSMYPDATRVLLATNYRCPPAVVASSSRLIDVNQERFAKRISPGKPKPVRAAKSGRAILAVATNLLDWPDRLARLASESTRLGTRACLLARTRAELAPVALALVRAGVPHAMSVPGPLDDSAVQALETDLRGIPGHEMPFAALLRLRAARGWRRVDQDDALSDDDDAALDAFIGWAAGFRSVTAFLAGLDAMRQRLVVLRDPSAPVELITVHAAKGREWETVIVLGFEEDRFPNRRALLGASEPARALEEERRLAYVALTRATQRLVLAFDPAQPSRFLAEMGFAAPTLRATP